ncbi:MAG: polysaccharide deacetylase family protein [Acutalibacteraceae bacterium]|nr:polysaccharide deacetylase family protein [Acutalibacteraceae bacterium]
MVFALTNQSVAVETISESNDEVYLPIIMYHSLLKDKNLQNDYTISPDLFEADLKYITENGYTTITVSDLIAYVYEDKDLPDNCIMITFDDGYYNNYYYAYPLLEKYKCRAVISPIVSMTEKFTETEDVSVSYGYITTDDINEMIDSGYVEIQNHSYDMHTITPRRGVEQKRGETLDEYKKIISEDITKAQTYIKENTGTTPQCFVYPFGAESESTLQIIKDLGFLCTLTCTEKANTITKDPDSLYELGRFRRDRNESMAQLLSRI